MSRKSFRNYDAQFDIEGLLQRCQYLLEIEKKARLVNDIYWESDMDDPTLHKAMEDLAKILWQ